MELLTFLKLLLQILRKMITSLMRTHLLSKDISFDAVGYFLQYETNKTNAGTVKVPIAMQNV